jgi:hypothetical protein
MKSEIKKLWLDALRSGEYQQGRHTLRGDDERFCCLGVLCDLAVKAKIVNWGEWPECQVEDEDSNRLCYRIGGATCYPPQPVMDWAGLEQCDPLLNCGEESQHSCSQLNDKFGQDFEAIARAIEKSL